MSKARYILVGGFLGAGKTTAILKAAEHLRDQGLRVGLITNDQSFGLVDTAMLLSHGFAVQEITGGCFCCKFDSLVEASRKLATAAAPDLFIAEPVGSCTDLKATVDYPLRRLYGDSFQIAPLSVLVDPTRAMRILGLEFGRTFSDKVVYIYRKQLEEAEIIVINKADLLGSQRLESLRATLEGEFPQARVQVMSARSGQGLAQWVEAILEQTPRLAAAMNVDYETYAEGEALLGWLNAAIAIQSPAQFDGNALVTGVARSIQSALDTRGIEIAHLKMTLTADEGSDIAVGNLIGGQTNAELSHTLQEPLDSGQLILNLRAEADPQILRELTVSSIEKATGNSDATVEFKHIECFRPGRPSPTHRLQSAGV